jgi:hypothetical protein
MSTTMPHTDRTVRSLPQNRSANPAKEGVGYGPHMGTDVFEHNRIDANGISIHTVSIGDGPLM